MAASELAQYYNRDRNSIDADTLVPYLTLIVIKAVSEVHQEKTDNSIDSLIFKSFLSRMIMIEHFTVQEMGYGESYYAFVTFKHIEKTIETTKIK